jgi:hypothetical protein
MEEGCLFNRLAFRRHDAVAKRQMVSFFLLPKTGGPLQSILPTFGRSMVAPTSAANPLYVFRTDR